MVYGQCGGVKWTGPTTCAAGSTCNYVNEYYSQCLPLSSSSTPKSTSTSSSTTSHASSSSSTSSSTSSSSSSAPSTTVTPTVPSGFVMTFGQSLYVYPSNEVYMVSGANTYWLAQLSDVDIHTALTDIANAGLTTVRTWGFNNVTTIPTSGAYFQLWQNSTATFNTGTNGIQRFDAVIASAKSLGLRLIVVLTNNWSDFGGMDVYVSQLSPGGTHDQFYTNNIILSAYLTYVTQLVLRYIDEPTIMAWELANQPRCLGSSGSGTEAPNSDPSGTTINDWAYVVSGYIKAIDPNHLVGIGDEGFFEENNPSSYPYGPGVGIDFTSNMEIPTVDFGTFHSFPDAWGQSGNETNWGKQWIADHFAIQQSVNKPVLLESFGVTTNQASVYDQWWQDIVSLGLTGDLIWQASSELSTGPSPNDGFAVYPTGPVYPVMSAAAEALKARGYPIYDSKNSN